MSDHQVESVETLTYGKNRRTLACSSVVLAAGPWTPDLLNQLLPQSSLKLDGIPVSGHWVRFRNPYPVTQQTIALVRLDRIVGEQLEFAGRDDGSIYLTGRRSNSTSLPVPGHEPQEDADMINELLERGTTFLRSAGHETTAPFHVLDHGCGIRPCRESGRLPVISEVPLRLLSGERTSRCQGHSGLFINWGHGPDGITLGLGSGKVMSQLVNNETPDVDLSPFMIRD